MANIIEGTAGRRYEVADNGVATLITEQRCFYCEDDDSIQDVCDACDASFAAQAEAERYAEFGMSWVAGGGQAEDVSAAWSMYR